MANLIGVWGGESERCLRNCLQVGGQRQDLHEIPLAGSALEAAAFHLKGGSDLARRLLILSHVMASADLIYYPPPPHFIFVYAFFMCLDEEQIGAGGCCLVSTALSQQLRLMAISKLPS